MTRKVLFLSAFIVLLSCTPAVIKNDNKTISETEEQEKITATSEQSYNSQETFLDSLNRSNEIGLSVYDFGREINPTIIQTVEKTGSGIEIRYRIQIFASANVESLREQKKSMEKKVELPFFLTFEPPFYKLFIGDFQLRSEAETMLSKVKRLGYTDAWIVTAKSISSN